MSSWIKWIKGLRRLRDSGIEGGGVRERPLEVGGEEGMEHRHKEGWPFDTIMLHDGKAETYL
jgi:hypothetical protein